MSNINKIVLKTSLRNRCKTKRIFRQSHIWEIKYCLTNLLFNYFKIRCRNSKKLKGLLKIIRMIISLHKNIKKGLNKMNFNKYKSKVYKKAKENKNNL